MDFKGSILEGKSKARYELLGRPSNGDVASGGQGEVWLARKLDTRAAEVAIKLLGQRGLDPVDPAALARRRRFDREIEVLKRLSDNHHAPRLEDEGRWEERPFFVMSLAPGTTLGALRKEQGGQLALLEAAPLMDAVARAVAAVHAKEVVHRDLKPANVHAEKRVGAWWATIVDFGLARLPQDDTLTTEAQALGTSAYQAPEARDDAHAVTPATDVFSLAVTFVELLTGQSTFGDDGQRWWSVARDELPEATLRAWLSAQRPGVPEAIWACLLRALRRSSSQRHADAEALAEALADAWARSPIVVSLDERGFTRSLQEAIDLAPRRAEIVVEAGKYVESLRVRNDVRVRAAQAGTVEVAPDGGRALVVEAGASSWTGLLLRGLDVDGGEPSFVDCTVLAQEAVVVMGPEARPVFRQCVLTGGMRALGVADRAAPALHGVKLRAASFGAIFTTGARGLVDEGSVIEGCENTALWIKEGADPTFRGVEIREGTGKGVDTEAGGHFEECTIEKRPIGVLIQAGGRPVLERCTVRDCGESGIEIRGDGRGTIADTTVIDSRYGIGAFDDSNPEVTSCAIKNAYVGILISGRSKGTYRRCEISDHATTGIVVAGDGHPLVSACKVHDGKAGGIFIRGGGAGTFDDCEAWNNGSSGITVAEDAHPTFKGCSAHDNAASGILVGGQSTPRFEDCDVRDNQLAGITVNDEARPFVSGTCFHGGKSCGIFVCKRGAPRFESCEVWGNELAGVEVSDEAHPTFSACTLRDGKKMGLWIREKAAVRVERCTVRNNAKTGIAAIDDATVSVVQSTITAGESACVVAQHRARISVESCHLEGKWGVAAVEGAWITARETNLAGEHGAGARDGVVMLDRCTLAPSTGLHATHRGAVHAFSCTLLGPDEGRIVEQTGGIVTLHDRKPAPQLPDVPPKAPSKP